MRDIITPCAEMVRRDDPDRFMAVMAAPPARRGGLFVLYAFNLEVARAAYLTSEPMIAEMRLQWWRDAVEASSPRAHEVAGPLHGLIGKGLPVAVLDRLIAARRWDCWREPHADAAALDAYLEATGAGLMWLAATLCGAGPQAEPAARALGWATGLAAYLRAVPALEARGRVPLPDESPAMLAQRGLARLEQARGWRNPAALAGWQTRALLQQVVTEPGRVAAGTLGLSEFRRRGSLLLRTLTSGAG